MAERDKLILGARASSPAMSAKRETVTASRSLRLSVLRNAPAGEGARAPSTNRLVPNQVDATRRIPNQPKRVVLPHAFASMSCIPVQYRYGDRTQGPLA